MNDNVGFPPAPIGARQVLEHRRHAEAFDFDHEGIRYHASFTRFGAPLEGPIAEMFITCAKMGSQAQYQTWETAVAASLALQYGCPADVLQRALPRLEDGSPAGVLAKFFTEFARLK